MISHLHPRDRERDRFDRRRREPQRFDDFDRLDIVPRLREERESRLQRRVIERRQFRERRLRVEIDLVRETRSFTPCVREQNLRIDVDERDQQRR